MTAVPTENAQYARALAALQLGRAQDAETDLRAILRTQSAHIGALNLLGVVLIQLGKFAEAESYLRQALQHQPKSDVTLYNYGIVLKALGRPTEALQRFTESLAINPTVAETWNNRGTALNELNRPEEALADLDKAIALNPRYAEAYYNKGKSLILLKRYTEALSMFDQALALKPDFAEAWLGRGHGCKGRKQFTDAIAAYDRALALKADLAEGWLACGDIYSELRRYEDALAAYQRAVALNPYLNYAASSLLHVKQLLCDWTDLERESAQLLSNIRHQKTLAFPFILLSVPSSPADQLRCARDHVQHQPPFSPIWRDEIYPHDRIHVAYVSADFREHPVGYLATELFEHHDTSRFQVTAISLGSDQHSATQQRTKVAVERFVDAEHNSDHEVAELMRALEIDIAVDLMGHTENARLGIFARRPAPVQVNYLGYLGTMGADFIDYIIADEIAVPLDRQKYYTESIVHLPNSFLANDNQLAIVPNAPSRMEVGLPDEGFVFCSFNNSYKIGPAMFALWMRLLRTVPKSVLWLAKSNEPMVSNLRREAERHNINPERLAFAPRVPLAEHLARQRLADLFLDTAPYNAGATCAAALWAGIPVLTMLGETFVGRMAGSMLHAVAMPELITVSPADYEALALKIATGPEFCASLKARLVNNRKSSPLFDTARLTRDIEAAYATMCRRYRAGKPPESFTVETVS